ncbi:MAG: hypothetical protein AAFZ15_30285 [Bacteroidota bacterium]
MNSLNKKLILISLSALALTATTAFIVQTDAYADLKIDFNLLTKENDLHKKQLKEQAQIIQQLGEEIRVKDDSIATLNVRVEYLLAETNKLKGKIRVLDQRMQQMHEKVEGLTKAISILEKGKSADFNKINELAKERNELLKQMELKDRERESEKIRLNSKQKDIASKKRSKKELEAQRTQQNEELKKLNLKVQSELKDPPADVPVEPNMAAQQSIEAQKEEIIKARKQARMREIVMNTKIEYRTISLKADKDGKELNRLKADGWRYTEIEFDLINPDQEAIFDEDFIIQIFDVDNQKVVPFNESNPGFPDSQIGSTGMQFNYQGQPMQITYFNSQKKTSKNYDIRFYYAGKGFLLPIPSGQTRIVEEGTVAAR